MSFDVTFRQLCGLMGGTSSLLGLIVAWALDYPWAIVVFSVFLVFDGALILWDWLEA